MTFINMPEALFFFPPQVTSTPSLPSSQTSSSHPMLSSTSPASMHPTPSLQVGLHTHVEFAVHMWKSQFHKCISDVQQTFSHLIFFKFPHVKCILSRVNYIHNIHIAGFFHMLSGIPSCENKVCHMRLWIKFELKYNHYIFFNVE